MTALDALMKVVFGYADEREARLDRENLKLAHYTTADTAMQILDGRKLWMRNATVMNDHSEIQHGHEIVSVALDTAPGANLRNTLGRIAPGLVSTGWPKLIRLSEVEKSKIFMISLSEHQADDRLGRLSMWRAYGGPVAGVALVFNIEVIKDPSINLGSVASPVLYGSHEEFAAELKSLSARLEANADLVRSIPLEMVGLILSSAIQYAYMSIKHIGFAEEQEWRLIHRPFEDGGNAWVRDKLVSIRGIPQLIYELPLDNIHNGMNIRGINLDRLLHRVIIGPSLYPATVQRAFIDKLTHSGVTNAAAKVVVSETPLRQWG
jgi:hypothetical protein